MPDKAYGEEKDTGKAYGRHIILETIKHKAELPHWVDVLIVRVIGLVHGLLFLGGMCVSGMGIALSAGVAPSWTSGAVSSMGSAVMTFTGTAIYALSVKRPDLLTIAMYGLVGLIGWVSCVATVLYILVAQVDSPVAGYIICNWNESEAQVAYDTLSVVGGLEENDPMICLPAEFAVPAPFINCSVRPTDPAEPCPRSRHRTRD